MLAHKGKLALVGVLLLIIGASFVSITGLAGVVPQMEGGVLWTTAVVMIATLPFILVKSMNLALLTALGGRVPSPEEWRRLEPLSRGVGGASDSRPILITNHDDVFSDIGFHAVTVPRLALERLDIDELQALLVQRTRRQENFIAPILGLCLWAALPMILGIAFTYLVFKLVRVVGKGMGGVADGLKPKTEFGAGVGLLFYLVVFAAFLVALFAGMVLLYQGLIALVVFGFAAWIFRRADLGVTADVARQGYGPALLSAIAVLDAADAPSTMLHQIFWPRASFRAHSSEIKVYQ
ncbi:hypothetical protein [Umezawaea beigongshangensis]|uniref:hypothetical protein n=1 Tax=Umezawaea beigongshangensis TaxID=2780383 RepID=UPI0018F19504|nr:hypothetical protein [Umezawaea beigongshangensis]